MIIDQLVFAAHLDAARGENEARNEMYQDTSDEHWNFQQSDAPKAHPVFFGSLRNRGAR